MEKLVLFADIDWKRSPKVRFELNRDVVADYAERYEKRETLPKPRVAEVKFDGEEEVTLLSIDGMHRIHGLKKNGQKGCQCEVVKMTPDEALREALGANREHGLRRSNADKRACVVSALVAWPDKSNLAIAQAVGVDDHTVNTVRKELEKAGKLDKDTERQDTKGRKVTPKSERAAATDPEDETGFAIPKEIRGAWEEANDVAEFLTASINTVITNVEQARKDKDVVFAEVNFSALTGDLEKAWKGIQAIRPYAVCPVCAGYPSMQDSGCSACKSRGYISKARWEMVPTEVKRARKKVAAVAANGQEAE